VPEFNPIGQNRKMEKYPARCNRESLISDARKMGREGGADVGRGACCVVVAGRIIGILDDGFVLQDESGRVDVVFDGKANVGDIVQVKLCVEKIMVEGKELAVFRGSDFVVLAPCESEFFIRKNDPNYRKMVVDLSIDERMKMRSRILDGIREFIKGKDSLEVETPSMVKLPGMEPNLDVFETEFVGARSDTVGEVEQSGDRGDGLRQRMFLITSPEYAMKKLLVSGLEKVFQICKTFRNGETGGAVHNPEFTMLEWYRAYASYEDVMRDTEELVENLAILVNGQAVIKFRGQEVDVSTPWPRMSVAEAFGGGEKVLESIDALREFVRKKGYKVDEKMSYEELFFTLFLNDVEPKLGFGRPVILHDYPLQLAALSKKCTGRPAFAERFEAYIAGVELCNGFTELNDWNEQAVRLGAEREERKAMGKTDYPVDESFVEALKFGMPPSGGNALGVDRLVMLLSEAEDIGDVLFFPFKDL